MFADFINPRGAEIAAVYRERFEGSPALGAPRTAVAAWALCAESDEEAQRLASSSRMTLSLLRQGRLIPVPPVDRALRYLNGQTATADGLARERRGIIGSPPPCAVAWWNWRASTAPRRYWS